MSQNANDMVSLVFMTVHNHLVAQPMTRREASDMMRQWYGFRDSRAKGSFFRRLLFRLWYFDCWGTFAQNLTLYESGESFCIWTIAWEHVIGMYIAETKSASERLTEAQIRIAKAMERSMDPDSDAPWRKGEDE